MMNNDLMWSDVWNEKKYWTRKDKDNNIVGFLHCSIGDFARNRIVENGRETDSGELIFTIREGRWKNSDITYLCEISEAQYTSYLEFEKGSN